MFNFEYGKDYSGPGYVTSGCGPGYVTSGGGPWVCD